MIVDRRKLRLSTGGSISKYYHRLRRVNHNFIYQNLHDEPDVWTLDQPRFMFRPDTGIYNIVTCGNDTWVRDDIIETDELMEFIRKKMKGGSGGEGAGEWTPVETDILFSGLKLPNLTKPSIESVETEVVRVGYSKTGGIIDYKKTFRTAIARRAALEGMINAEILATKDKEKLQELEEKKKDITFIDDKDVRYRRFDEVSKPSKKMVMFLVMDVSGSMGDGERNLAKQFSSLVVKFLSQSYDKCAVEYVIFTNEAFRVDKEEFFHGNQSGGTILSTGLQLTQQIMSEDYANDWNVYTMVLCDNGISDLFKTQAWIRRLLPQNQYFMYASIGANDMNTYWDLVEDLINNPAFNSSIIKTEDDIVPEFIKLFSGD